jgi:hypothetical protein
MSQLTKFLKKVLNVEKLDIGEFAEEKVEGFWNGTVLPAVKTGLKAEVLPALEDMLGKTIKQFNGVEIAEPDTTVAEIIADIVNKVGGQIDIAVDKLDAVVKKLIDKIDGKVDGLPTAEIATPTAMFAVNESPATITEASPEPAEDTA